MKKIMIVILFMLSIFLTGCNDDPADFDYVDSGITIGGDTIYYRDYTVATNCTLFDIFQLYEEGLYYYAEPHYSMTNQCASALYVENQGEYVEVRYAYNIGVYDQAQIEAVTWGFTVYPSSILPSQATLATILAEIVVDEKQLILNDALAVSNAAKLYCAQTTCTETEELLWTDLSVYISGLDVNMYLLTNNGGIVAKKVSGQWLIDLERAGTGEFEFPEYGDPSLLVANDIIIDVD